MSLIIKLGASNNQSNCSFVMSFRTVSALVFFLYPLPYQVFNNNTHTKNHINKTDGNFTFKTGQAFLLKGNFIKTCFNNLSDLIQ